MIARGARSDQSDYNVVIKVWGRITSINVSKVLWALDEVGARYTRSDALTDPNAATPEFLSMNPNARVPVINDEGFVLWESNAIVRYVSYKYGLGTVYPTDVRERAEAEQWMDWQQTSVSPPLAYPFHALVRKHPQYRDENVLRRASETLDRTWSILDAHLAERQFVLGDAFTMADIPVGTAAWRWLNMPLDRTHTPHLERWLDRLKAREGFKRHIMHPLR